MVKIEVTCSCGKVFTMRDDQFKRCPQCGKIHYGTVVAQQA